MAANDDVLFSIDELAARSGVSSRTIRYYQTEELLPAPDRRGRRGVYNLGHLHRLQMVTRLQEKGMTLSEIREMLDDLDIADPGQTDEWVQVGGALLLGWVSGANPYRLTPEDLEMIGPMPAGSPALKRLLEAGVIRIDEEGGVSVPSREAKDRMVELRKAGVDVEPVMESMVAIHDAMETLSRRLIEIFAADPLLLGRTPAEIAKAVELLAPMALDTVQAVFTAQMDERIHSWIQQAGVETVRGVTAPRATC